jgi:oxygen-independent coproporphyrinogen-3 oxidase
VQGQSLAQVTRDARTAVSLGANHLSAYALTLDRESLAEDVPLARQLARGEVTLPPDDEVVAMQRVVRDTYRAAGLHRYEVSNYAQPGYHSRHNATYWTQGEYLALGTGATGFLREGAQAFRYSNHRSGERYLQALEAGEGAEASREPLTARELFEERVAMGLRLVNGVDLQAVCEAFGERFEARALTVKHLLGAGLLVADGPRLRLTDEGLDVHSAIAARLM